MVSAYMLHKQGACLKRKTSSGHIWMKCMVESIPKEEIGQGFRADFNGHVGEWKRGDEDVMGRYSDKPKMQKDRLWWISR